MYIEKLVVGVVASQEETYCRGAWIACCYQIIAITSTHRCMFKQKKQPCINCIYTTLQCNLVLGLTCYGLAARLVVAAIIAILVITVKSTNSQIFSAQTYAIDKRPDHNMVLPNPLMRLM